ncbi:MAG: hypothetical protein WCC63_04220 [Candidatus Bathyarchaeia archaeon]
MRGTIRRYRLGYALGAVLCLIGIVSLLAVAWKAYEGMATTDDPMYVFWSFIWKEELGSLMGIQFKPVFLLILAAVTLVSGGAVFAFSRQRFFLPGKILKLQCPFCRKYWTASYDRGQVLCPHCNHLIHPKIIEK